MGKRLMLPVGQPGAVAIALRGVAGRLRWSKLGDWLAARLASPLSDR